MTFFDRTTRVEMAGNALTEYPDGVPTHVADFAMALVDARCLGEGLEHSARSRTGGAASLVQI